MNYEELSFKEIQELVKSNPKDFDSIPIETLRRIAKEDYEKDIIKIDDSDIKITYSIDEFLFEVSYLEIGKKIKLFLKKNNGEYVECFKSSATHVLEQIFDENGNIVQENLKLKI